MKKLLIVSVLAVIALTVLNLTYDPGYKADAVYQMANRHIEWTYAGK